MGTLQITALVFIASLVIFHSLMFFLKVQRRLWKYADYAWLSVLILGLAPATYAARDLLASGKLPTAEIRYRATVERALDQADASIRYFNMMHWAPANLPEGDNRVEMAIAFDTAEAWFSQAREKLGGFPPGKAWRDLIADISALEATGDSMVLQDSMAFATILSNFANAEDEYFELCAASERSSWEQLAVVFSPWLVAVALALRLTKVTANIWNYA